MVSQIENSFELAPDEEETEILRRQRELEEWCEKEYGKSDDDAGDAPVELIKAFANADNFESTEIVSRVISKHKQLLDGLNLLHQSQWRMNDSYLPKYPSNRMRKEIILTYIPWVDEEIPVIGQLFADRTGCPVVNLEFEPYENGYHFRLDEDFVGNFERLGWKFVIYSPSMVEDEFKMDPWQWTVQLRNQLEEAGATDIKALPFKSLDPRRELIPNSFALGGFDLDFTLSSELYLHDQLWAPAVFTGRNIADEMETVSDDEGVAIDITPISWDEFKFMRAEAQVIESRAFPVPHSVGVPAVEREAGMIKDYPVPPTVQLKPVLAPHGLRKTQNVLTDFNQRIKQWGGCAITITPLRSVNASIASHFGGQTRGDLLDHRTHQSLETVTNEFLLGTPEQRHSIICAESLTHKSKIGLNLGRLKEAWVLLDDRLNKERVAAWKAAGSKGKKPKRQTLAPTIDIIIDEAPIVIDRILEGATVRNPGLTIDTFTELIKFAVSTGGRISIMSADLTAKEVQLFSALLNLKDDDWLNPNIVSCINAGVRTALPNKRLIYLSNHLQATKKRIYQAVESAIATKQVVFIASNKIKPSSTATSTLAEQIRVNVGEHVRILELNSRTVINRQHAAFEFMNASEHGQMQLLQDVDVIIATSVVEAGVSWDSRLFDDVPNDLIRNIFCIDVDGRWSSSGILQAINRWRNPAVPAEICTTDRRMCSKEYRFDDDFSVKRIIKRMVDDRDAFTMMMIGIFGHRKLERGAWVTALAHKESQQQIQLRNPLAAVSAVAKSMGHIVTRLDDSDFNQGDKIEAQKQAKLITQRHRHIRNAVAARAISLEGAARIQDCTTTLVYERVRTQIAVAPADADIRALLQVGIDELIDRNYQLSKKGKQPTTVRGIAMQNQKLAAFHYLSLGHRLTLKAFQLLQATGLTTNLNAADVDDDDAGSVVEMAKMFVGDVEAGTETLLPVLDIKGLKELSKQPTKTDETQMMLERLAVIEEFCLDEELSGPGVELPPYEWMDLTHTEVPKILRKRFIIEADEKTLEDICQASLFDIPVDTSTGRILEVVGQVRAAHHGVRSKAFERLTSLESVFGVAVNGDDYVAFVRDSMVDSSWLTDTDIDSIGNRWSSCAKWIVTNIDRIDQHSKGHVFLFSDSAELIELAELIHRFRNELGGLIENAHNSLQQKGGSSNHLRYLRSVLNECSLFALETLGNVNVGRQRKTLLVLRRRLNVPTAEECTRLYQRWLDAMEQSLYELNALITFELGEREVRMAQAANPLCDITADTSLRRELKYLSAQTRQRYQAMSDEQLQEILINFPSYKGYSAFVSLKLKKSKYKAYRRRNRRILK